MDLITIVMLISHAQSMIDYIPWVSRNLEKKILALLPNVFTASAQAYTTANTY